MGFYEEGLVKRRDIISILRMLDISWLLIQVPWWCQEGTAIAPPQAMGSNAT